MNRRLMMERICATIGEVYPDSFQSCSHGAGRAMSRTEAVRNFSLETEVSRLEAPGIVHAIRGQKDLEEAAGLTRT